MSDERNAVVNYISERFAREDTVLKQILDAQRAGGGPMMNIGPDQGKLLALLVKLMRPQNVLEVGSYYGYSAVWIARALRGGVIARSEATKQSIPALHCIEVSEPQCKILHEHMKLAEVDDLVKIYQGSGIDVMNKFIDEGRQFEMVFIDADKANYSNYLDLSAKLIPSGGLLLVDNCLWNGQVIDSSFNDNQTQAIRDFNDKLAKSKDFESVILTVQDGLALAVKK